MLSEEVRETLEIFIEKASFLKECLSKEDSIRMAFISCKTGEDIWRTHPTLQMLLPTFRMFVQSGDKFAIYIIDPTRPQRTIFDLSGMPDWWYGKVRQSQESIAAVLACTPPGLVYNGESLTRQKVFDTYFYGNEVHANREHRTVIKQWKSDSNLFQGILLTYLDVLIWIINQVCEVAEACRAVLTAQQDCE